MDLFDRFAGAGALRRLAGWVWMSAWIVVLYLVASPWRDLGGLESERLRWLEWFVLVVGMTLGFTLGRIARDAALGSPARTHARLLRFVLYPPAAITAAALIGLAWAEQRGAVGVVVTAFLAYWAGLDLAFGAVPLMEGKSYAFERPLEPEPERGTSRRDPDWIPPWERP